MVVAMHIRLAFVVILVTLLALPAWGQVEADQDAIDSSSGPVEMEPDTSEDVISIPIDEESGQVNWAEYLALPPGVGANWGFITVLYPPDPSALFNCPEILLDTAWLPPIPYSYGFEPPAGLNASTTGWWYLEDSSGNLARRDMTITTDLDSWGVSTWFMGGVNALHIEEGWQNGYLSEEYYLPDDWTGPGIDFFLKTVWFRGVTIGDRMQQLLNICSAQRIGGDMMNGGRDRQLIYQIPANELDRQNGRGSLLVWISVGHYQLIKTRLHTVYATEVTHFENIQEGVELDPEVYYSDFLPSDIFWSIDQYLLTHATPFFEIPGEVSYTADTTLNVEGNDAEAGTGNTEEDSLESVTEE